MERVLQGLRQAEDTAQKNDWLAQLIEESKVIEYNEASPEHVDLLRLLRLLVLDKDKDVRANALRAARYLIKGEEIIRAMLRLNFDLFLCRSLERDAKFLWERMQSLKLIRQIMLVAPHLIPRSVIQSLVSIAEHPKDDFRRISLDAIRELVLTNPGVVASCNGIKTIVDSILDSSCSDIAGSLTLTLLFLLDQDNTRQYIRPGLDIAKLLSVFTDMETANSPEKEARRAAAHKALVTMMRSWTGILSLTSDPNGLRSLVQLLGLPPSVKGSSWAKEAIFDLLIEIMHAVKSADLQVRGNRNLWKIMGPNLLHSYIVVVLVAFMDCGLVQILTRLGMSQDPEFSGVATDLLTEILQLSSNLLPRSVCAQLNALPSVVQQSAAFSGDLKKRARALNMITGLSGTEQTIGLDSSVYESGDFLGRARLLSNSLEVRPRRHERDSIPARGINVDHIIFADQEEGQKGSSANNRGLPLLRGYVDNGLDDDAELQAKLRKSQVLNGKDNKQWDFDVCLGLLRGPLIGQPALGATLKTKFIKRLLSFLKPSKQHFSDLPWNTANLVFVRVGCQLFRVMLSHQEGRDYQFFNELIDEIIQVVINEIDRYSGLTVAENTQEEKSKTNKTLAALVSTSKSTMTGTAKTPVAPRVLHRSQCEQKLAREYFTFLGILSESKYGRTILDKRPRLFQALQILSKVPSLNYLTRLVTYNMSYQHAKTRELFKQWLEEAGLQVRLMIISKLRLMLRTLNHLDPKNNSAAQWAISLLIVQVKPDVTPFSHDDRECALCALSVLEEACQKRLYLDILIALKPNFDLVGEAAHNLQITFLSTIAGFDLLHSSNWIETQLKRWRADGGGNQRYVETLENALVSALNAPADSVTAATTNAADGLPACSPSSYHPVGQPGQQPWAKSIGIRSKEDEYYFRRLHQIPWIIKVQVINHKGRSMQLIIECDVQTRYANKHEGEGLRTHVVGTVLNNDGNAEPKKIDSNSTIKARISVGAVVTNGGNEMESPSGFPARTASGNGGAYGFEDSRDHEKICSPDDRKTLNDKDTVLMGDLIRWEFEWGAQGPELKAVWFQIPTAQTSVTAVLVAPHLYGELARTERGCTMLRASGHFGEFVDCIKSSQSSAIQKRAALWSIGQIGSSDRGFGLFEGTGCLEFISNQAKQFHVLSMRGACFYILGLLSRSEEARAELKNIGWQFSSNPDAGTVVPEIISSFLSLPKTPQVKPWAFDPKNIFGIRSVPSKSKTPGSNGQEEMESNTDPNCRGAVVLGHISNLCNHVTQKSSLQALRTMRADRKNRAIFSSPTMLFETFKLLSSYTYRLPARRFILFDLFTWIEFDDFTMLTFDRDFNSPTNDDELALYLQKEAAKVSSKPDRLDQPISESNTGDDV